MGLFSSKYKTYVGTSVSRFTDSKEFISSKTKGTISGIARKEDIAEHTLENLVNSTGFRAKKAFNYAGSGYVFGRPNDTLFAKDGSNATTNIAISNYLTSLGATEVFYTKFGVNNYYHKLYKLLHTEHAFNFNTGELPLLTAEKGFTVTLVSVSLLNNPANIAEDINSFSSIDFYPTSLVSSTEFSRLGAKMVYEWTEEISILGLPVFIDHTEELILSSDFFFTDVDFAKTMYMSAYADSVGNIQFLDYEQATGIAALDNIFDTSYSVPGDYLPRIYFRWDNQSSSFDKNSIEYLHGKRMSKKLGINYDNVIDAVHAIDEDRTEEDLNEVKSVLLMYAVPADATDQVELQYLYKHFENWYDIVGGTTTTDSLEDFNAGYQLSYNNEHVLVIEDTRFKLTIGMQGIWKRTVTGSIGAVGTYGTAKGTMNVFTSFEEYAESSYVVTTVNTYPWHVYRHQTTETTYVEYQVVGLETRYFVLGDHESASGYTEDVEDPKDILYVPINYIIVKDLPIFVQEELMYKSMQIIANSVVVIKVKWYQRSGWVSLLKIIALAALINGLIEGFELIYALISVASVSAAWAFELIIQYLIQYIAVAAAAALFVKAAGEDVAMLAAILLVVTGAGKSLGVNNYYATEMLSYGSALFQEIGTSLDKEFNALKMQYATFVKESTEELDELKAALEEFDNPNQKYAKILLGQTPTEFFNKVHEGNIGRRVFDVIPNYVKLSLDLSLRPTYSEV